MQFQQCFVVIHKYIHVLISKVHKFNNSVIHCLVYPNLKLVLWLFLRINQGFKSHRTMDTVNSPVRYVRPT